MRSESCVNCVVVVITGVVSVVGVSKVHKEFVVTSESRMYSTVLYCESSIQF